MSAAKGRCAIVIVKSFMSRDGRSWVPRDLTGEEKALIGDALKWINSMTDSEILELPNIGKAALKWARANKGKAST